jgi:glucan biosynthesis protein C
MQDNNRIYFLDSMRSVLMMLGVVVHSAYVFTTSQSWLIFDQDTTPFADHLIAAIQLFRLPAFFVVSGFFCVLTLARYKVRKFSQVRLKRIAVPLLATAITFNSMQAYFLHKTGFRPFDTTDYFLNGGWVSHLWFLVNLIVYFAIAALLAWLLERPTAKLGSQLGNLFDSAPITLVVAALPLSAIAVLATNSLGFPLYSDVYGVLHTHSLLIHAPFFIFGAILATRPKLLYRFATIPLVVSVSLVAVSLIVGEFVDPQSGLVFDIVTAYFRYLSIWFSIAICFYVFHACFNSDTRTWRFLSDASYTVYLFHHLLVVVVGYAVIQLDLRPLPGLLLLVTIVGIVAILMHKVIVLRVPMLRLLYNGK